MTIALYDLNVLLDDSVRALTVWRLYTRLLVVNVVAFLEAFDRIDRKGTLWQHIQLLGVRTEAPHEWRDIKDNYRELKKHEHYLKEIRNAAIAHTADEDALTQLEMIHTKLDPMRVQELAYHVINWQARLVSFLTKWFELKHQELDEELARIRTNAAS